MFVSDDVIEAGNIMTTRCEKDFPLLSTEPRGYHDFCATQTDFPVWSSRKSSIFLFTRVFHHPFHFPVNVTQRIQFAHVSSAYRSEGIHGHRQNTTIYRNPLNYVHDPLQHFITHSATVNANIVCHASLENISRYSGLLHIFLQLYVQSHSKNISNIQLNKYKDLEKSNNKCNN